MAANAINRMRGGITPAARPKLGNVQIRETPDADSNTQLQLFRVLIGIDTPLNLTHNSDSGSKEEETVSSSPPSVTSRVRGKNLGLFQRAKDQERRSRIAYLFTSYIGNTMFLVQIILAAAFTGLSAYKDAHAVTLTTLGALNTVVAGYAKTTNHATNHLSWLTSPSPPRSCLAWQKGQGVPERYRKAQDQYQALILEIEMTERSFMQVGNDDGTHASQLDARAEAFRLQKLFDLARADQQANYPDLYVSTAAMVGKHDSKALEEQLEEVKVQAARVQAELMAKVEGLVSRAEGKAVGRVERSIEEVLGG
jgi:hypothetical protein